MFMTRKWKAPACMRSAQECRVCVCVFITAGHSNKLFVWEGGGDMGGHVLRETTSRGLCGLGCPYPRFSLELKGLSAAQVQFGPQMQFDLEAFPVKLDD